MRASSNGSIPMECRLLKHGKMATSRHPCKLSIKRNASDPKPQESSPALPAQPETPNDGHLAGLLTHASPNLKRLPGSSQWHVAQVLSEYSCGAVADSHRASHYQMEEVIEDERGRVKSESNST